MVLKEQMYALVLRGTTTVVAIEQGLFYGQPTAAVNPIFITKEELDRLMGNKAFVKNLLDRLVEIRSVEISMGPIVVIEPYFEPTEIKYRIR